MPRGLLSEDTPHTTMARSTRDQKRLQRRIFLNTLRNVYPGSIRLHYEPAEPSTDNLNAPVEWIMTPGTTVRDSCPEIGDRLWSALAAELHGVFLRHVQRRQWVMSMAWLSLLLAATVFTVLGWHYGVWAETAYRASGPVLFLFALVLVPSIAFTYGTVRPMLLDFDQWRQHLIMQFDKHGIEVIKITTGEIVSDAAPWRWLWTLWYGSSVWFRFEDASVEVFWRSVKSGRHVRRYSYMAGGNGVSAGAVEVGEAGSAPASATAIMMDTTSCVREEPQLMGVDGDEDAAEACTDACSSKKKPDIVVEEASDVGESTQTLTRSAPELNDVELE